MDNHGNIKNNFTILDDRGKSQRFCFFTDMFIGSDRFVVLIRVATKTDPVFMFLKSEISTKEEEILIIVEDETETGYLFECFKRKEKEKKPSVLHNFVQ